MTLAKRSRFTRITSGTSGCFTGVIAGTTNGSRSISRHSRIGSNCWTVSAAVSNDGCCGQRKLGALRNALANYFRKPILQVYEPGAAKLQVPSSKLILRDMKNASPLILISGSTERRGAEFADTSLSLSMNYPKAIKAAGGVPSVLPCMPDRDFVAEVVKRCDGVLLTGGDDVQPSLYTKDLSPELRKTVHTAAPERDLFELMVIDEVFRQRKPLLAICRGHQILNVALGGTLIVDIPSQVPNAINHSRMDLKNQVVHEAEVKPGSRLAEITGKARLGVNSTHHQAVGKVAKPLRANAVSIDGIIEGMELAPDGQTMLPWLLAVQFHPERLFSQHAEHLDIFKAFVRAVPVR